MERIVALSKFHQSYECNCQICWEEFNTEDKRPYIICANQHISCMKCLNQYFLKQSQEQKYLCHFCRLQIFKDKLIELKPLLSLLQKVKMQKQQNDRLVNKFSSCNKWKKNEVNEILETLTTKFINKFQESDGNTIAQIVKMKEQIMKKTSHQQAQYQTLQQQMGKWMKSMQIKNQQILDQTKKVLSLNTKLGEENKQLFRNILQRNEEIFKSKDQQNGKINKVLSQIQFQTHKIIQLNEKYLQEKCNLVEEKVLINKNQKNVQKITLQKNIINKNVEKEKQIINGEINQIINKGQANEQNHRWMRSYTTNLNLSICQVKEEQIDDKSKDLKRQKKLNNLIKEEVKQIKINPQINSNSKKLDKNQISIINNKTNFSKKAYPQTIINSKKQSPEITNSSRRYILSSQQEAVKKNDQQKQKNPLQSNNKIDKWKKAMQLDFLNNQDINPIIGLKQSTMLPTSAKNSYNSIKLDEDLSLRRSFGTTDNLSVRNYTYGNKKNLKNDIFGDLQRQRKKKFLQKITEIYGKQYKQQYQKFYQKISYLKTNEELIILWGEKIEGDLKKKIYKDGK